MRSRVLFDVFVCVVAALLCFLAAVASAAEIKMVGPESPILPREYTQILLPDSGTSDAELAGLSLEVEPKTEVTVIPARFWGGAPFILFSARQPGTYTITVSANAWAGSLSSSIESAIPHLDAKTAEALRSISADVSQMHPARIGICVVEVAGENPTPPPPSANPYQKPVGELLTAAQRITEIKMSRADATMLATLYKDASRLVASAPAAKAAGTKPEIATTSELRAWLVSNGRELGLQGKYAGLPDAVDAYLGRQLGTAIRDVTETDAAALAALAWGVWEAGR